MLNVIMLAAVTVALFAQNIFQKQYTIKFGEIKNSNFIFNFLTAFTAFLIFAVLAPFFFEVDGGTVLRAGLFAVFAGISLTFQFISIKYGSLAITALAISFSLVIPTLYGVIFLGETLSAVGYVGLGALAASLVLVNITGRGESKINAKTLLFAFLAFLGNGLCSTMMKIQQTEIIEKLGDASFSATMGYSVSFMFFAMLFICVIFGVLCGIFRTEKSELKPLLKRGSKFALSMGVMNALVNTLVLILAGRIAAVILYPVVSAGGIALTFAVALLVYKEKLKSWQYVGYVLGVAAVVLLSL